MRPQTSRRRNIELDIPHWPGLGERNTKWKGDDGTQTEHPRLLAHLHNLR